MAAIASYLPASIVTFLEKRAQLKGGELKAPFTDTYQSVVLFADVWGFTSICEAAATNGLFGNEQIQRHLNSYFEQLVRIVSSQGGDVFKFAGDAVLVLWPRSDEDLTTTARRASQCALEISEKLKEVRLAGQVELSVKIGIGVGEVCVMHVGGVLTRMEYLATGEPLTQAFLAEQHATKCEVVASPRVWDMVQDFFQAEVKEDGFAFLQ